MPLTDGMPRSSVEDGEIMQLSRGEAVETVVAVFGHVAHAP
jgi:hypothetical protein